MNIKQRNFFLRNYHYLMRQRLQKALPPLQRPALVVFRHVNLSFFKSLVYSQKIPSLWISRVSIHDTIILLSTESQVVSNA
jgi:hypothetical protein